MYGFCINSPHYKMLLENIHKEGVVQEIEDACNSFSNAVCSSENPSGIEICKKIVYMYKFLDKVQSSRNSKNTLTNEDLDFLNYWLNATLKSKNSDISICIEEFYKAMKTKEEYFISNKINLEKRLQVIDPSKLENMELLSELYDTKQKIIDIMFHQDGTVDKKELCKEYTKKCHDKYIEGMKNCLNSYDDFYKALKLFEGGYNYLTDEVSNTSENCKINEHIRLPNYDPVLETEQRRIMTFKIMSAPLMLPFIIPLLYKYTPLGPFLRTKINMIKNSWMNSDEYGSELSSLLTDIEDNISDNGEYNIGYSETN
ncbi:PIR Superfamily Protein [Plasmodium ovale curtisi]|uniref:PIR Superfamily Protein n=1 Tax=Plasmodium ovale curtisi TaxID=864141 RepID=A0A1A8XC89_PLAOA|nr:PIR Superfamily Protein [Plasmodium ovale curtisi]SBT02840.1 PIR Superfamily Protein [Plasmodium ovale curtisi]